MIFLKAERYGKEIGEYHNYNYRADCSGNAVGDAVRQQPVRGEKPQLCGCKN